MFFFHKRNPLKKHLLNGFLFGHHMKYIKILLSYSPFSIHYLMPLYTVVSHITEVIKVIWKKRNGTCTAMRGDGKGGEQVGERDGGSCGLIIK